MIVPADNVNEINSSLSFSTDPFGELIITKYDLISL
jgi:hypothetical protein